MDLAMKNYLREVESEILRLKSVPKPEKWAAKNYVGAGLSELNYLDSKIPDTRRIFKKNNFSFRHLPIEKQWKIWDFIWKKSKYFEVMLLPIYWAHSRSDQELLSFQKYVLTWTNRCDNWAHSDGLSQIYARMLEYAPSEILPIYEAWSQSPKPWLRRQAIVGLLYYSSQRNTYVSFATMKKFILRLLHDEHFYVQKGIGWALREAWNIYPQQTEKLLLQIADQIPAAGWTAATEKLKLSFKMQLKKRRKK